MTAKYLRTENDSHGSATEKIWLEKQRRWEERQRWLKTTGIYLGFAFGFGFFVALIPTILRAIY